MKEYFQMFARAFDFKGRSTIREFWLAMLFNLVADAFFALITLPFIGDLNIYLIAYESLTALYGFLTFVPMLSLTARRLRDTGRSGWNVLLALFFPIGFVILIVYLCQPSGFSVKPWIADPDGEGKTFEQLKKEVEEQNAQTYGEENDITDVDYKIDDLEPKEQKQPEKPEQQKDTNDTDNLEHKRMLEQKKMDYKKKRIAELENLKQEGKISDEEYSEMVSKILNEK